MHLNNDFHIITFHVSYPLGPGRFVFFFLHDLPQKDGAVNKPVSYSTITFYNLLLYPLSFYKKFTFPNDSANPPFACP